MLNIGMMFVRNESDALEEIIHKHLQYVDELFVMDNGSTDKTVEIVRSFDKITFCGVHDLYMPEGRMRQHLLKEIRMKYGWDEEYWITLMNGDEVFYHDPRKVIEAAEESECYFVTWHSCLFVLHESERESSFFEDSKLSIEERRKWYIYNWFEQRQFKHISEANYTEDQMDGLPKQYYDYNRFPMYPILKHLHFRSPEQSMKRIVDRIYAQPFQVMYKFNIKYGIFFTPDMVRLFGYEHKTRLYGPRYFDGSFHELEKGMKHLK